MMTLRKEEIDEICFKRKNGLKTTWYLRNDEGQILTSKLRIDIINLVKGKDLCYTGSEKVDYLINWCKLLTTKDRENVKDISSQIMSHKSTDMLVNNMSALSEEDEMVKLYTKLSRREMEYNTYIAEATEEGYNKGHEKGYNEGLDQKNNEIAKKMLEEKLPLETISKITGLSNEEITELNK